MEDGSHTCDGSGTTTSTTVIGERGSFGCDDWNNACSTTSVPSCAGIDGTNGLFVDHQSAGPPTNLLAFEVLTSIPLSKKHTSIPLTHTANTMCACSV
jgi:hypothetical protein